MVGGVLFVVSDFAVRVREVSQIIVTLALGTNQLLRI